MHRNCRCADPGVSGGREWPDEPESISMAPAIAMLAFPEMLGAPRALGSRTMIDGSMVIVRVVAPLARKLLSPE